MNRTQSNGLILGTLAAAALIVSWSALSRRWKHVPVATERLELLEVPVDPLTMAEALARIETFILARTPHHVFTADALGIMRAQDDPELLDIVRQADLITPDGAGVMFASGLHGARLPERVSGVDLVEQLSALSAGKGYRIYLFGAAPGVADAAAVCLKSRYPSLRIAGSRHGFFAPEEEAGIVRDIAAAQPDILFVALGIPKQEQFIRRHFHELGVPAMLGIGGSFDVISGRLHRAPHWMQRLSLEWLYRLLQEPSRLPRITALPRFIMAAWKTRKAGCSDPRHCP